MQKKTQQSKRLTKVRSKEPLLFPRPLDFGRPVAPWLPALGNLLLYHLSFAAPTNIDARQKTTVKQSLKY